MAKVTIEDISRHTGLSRGTVSRALNDRPDIYEQTKQRVLEACRKLNYSPSHAARSLATGRSFAAAVVVRDFESAFSGAFLRGILSRALDAHYAVHVVELGTGVERQRHVLRASISERIDCLLLSAEVDPAATSVLEERIEKRPVAATVTTETLAADVFAPDNTESGRLIARHLLERQATNVIYLHRAREAGARERLAGFREIWQQRGLDPDTAVLEMPADGRLTGDLADRLTERLRGAEGVAASDDFLAVDALLLAQRAGRRPGSDLSIVGQGNERIGRELACALTTTDLSGEEIGQRAMDTLLARLNKTRMDAPEATRVAPQLIVRESSTPA